MTILFYSVSDRKNRLSKTLGTATSLTGTLREPVSLTDPEILIESATVPAYNYAYISDLGRYYFIVSVVAEQYSIYRLRMHVDVLMSYKGLKNGASSTGIYGLQALISRQQESLMYGLPETLNPVNAETDVVLASTISGTVPGWEGTADMFKATGTKLKKYRLMIPESWSGDYASNLPIATYITDIDGFAYLMKEIPKITSTFGSKTILDEIYEFSALPFEMSSLITVTGGYSIIPAGFTGTITLAATDGSTPLSWRRPALSSFAPHTSEWTMSISNPSTTYQFRRWAPYQKIAMRFRPFGKFELDPGVIFRGATTASTTFKVKVETDPLSGNASLFYGKSSADIYLGSANVLIKFPLSAQSYSMAKIASGALSLVGSIAATVATEGMAAPSIAAAAINATSSAIPSTSVTGGEQIIIDSQPYIEQYKKSSPDYPYTYRGLPVHAIDVIYELSGYTEVEKVNIEGSGFASILDSERTELENIMKGGFYA